MKHRDNLELIKEYLGNGGLFNPEMMEHEKVRDLIMACREEIKLLRATLGKIERWEMPQTGRFWDEEKMHPMRYSECYGSNGERDYVRRIAEAALNPAGRCPADSTQPGDDAIMT